MWDQWRNWADKRAISFFQSAEWAETLVRNYPFYRPEPVMGKTYFLPLLRRRRFGWLSDSLYGMPMMTTGGVLTEEGDFEKAWSEVGESLLRKQVGNIVLTLPAKESRVPYLEGWIRVEATTHLIDLSPGWETVYSRFNKSCKEAIRRAIRLGVQISREENEIGIETHWSLIRTQFEKWNPDPPITPALIRDLAKLRQTRLYVARIDGHAVLSMLSFVYGGEIFLWQSARSLEDFPPGTSNLLTSTLFREACESGLRTANFGGSVGDSKIERYKEAYGAVKTPFAILKRTHPLIKPFR